MLSEECGLAPFLAGQGIDAVESDLGERIMQLMHRPPSHIVLPAIHVRREEVGELFERELGTARGDSDPTYLTHEARKHLRGKFLTADVAMTGVNFAVASEGAFAVCTNEGNADLGTSFPDLHIAIMGLEKVVPDYRSLAVFTRLLARSATGQPVTAYTSLYRRPEPGKQIHVVIVDNGRTESLRNEAHRNMLKCLRCGACMNTCPVYRRSGGYSYSNVCPARIDLGEQIYAWRQEMDADGVADTRKKLAVEGMDVVMRHKTLFYTGLKLIPWVPRFVYNNRFNPWCAGREMPHFARRSFNELWKEGKIATEKKEKR